MGGGDAVTGAPQLAWLIRLRWAAVMGQAATIALVHLAIGIRLPLAALTSLVAVEAGTNVVLMVLRPTMNIRRVDGLMAATLGFDITVLTGLLLFTGGPFNPFSFLYLVYITLAAVVLRTSWTWGLVGLSLFLSGGLFYGDVWWGPRGAAAMNHADHMRMHLQGMWIAFGVAACFIAYFVTRVRSALADRETALAAERALAVRSERLAALATLSAGAAHELATPLGTIAIVAKELEREAETAGSATLDDVRLIRSQVERCRAILIQMAADAGNPAGEAPRRVTLAALVEEALASLPRAPNAGDAADPGAAAEADGRGTGSGTGKVSVDVDVDIEVDDRALGIEVMVPPRAVSQALRAVLKNAVDSSRAVAPVVGAEERRRRSVVIQGCAVSPGWGGIRVRDDGPGMTAEVLSRAGEPFFTTKPPGKGMGLGLFLARTVIGRVGGRLEIASQPGRGTDVVVLLPLALALPHGPVVGQGSADGSDRAAVAAAPAVAPAAAARRPT